MAKGIEERAERDRKLGGRVRRKWNRIITAAKDYGLSEAQLRGFVSGGGLTATEAERRKLAKALGFDWEGAAQFFAKIAPIIEEMMASCSA